jgi:DNA-binding MarR family transcriptional regulator
MELGKEIQQKSFKSPHQKLAINLFYTTNWLSYHYEGFFKGKDLTTQQFNVLRILRGQYPNPCSIKLIKERMLDRMSDTSRIVDKLFTKKLLQRNECPNDRRSVNVIITDKGLELLKSLDYIDELAKQNTKSLTQDEINTLNDLLDKLRD